MNKEDLYKQFVDRYLEGSASTDEVELFFHLLNKGELDGILEEGAAVHFALSGCQNTAKVSKPWAE